MSDTSDNGDTAALLKMQNSVRNLGSTYRDRFQRARRIFIEERAAALVNMREKEYIIKSAVSQHFSVPYTSICFAGSAQLGFSTYKNRLFKTASSDLDVACIDMGLFERAWVDVVSTTRAFTDETKFSGLDNYEVQRFKEGILRRGMIMVELMPRSDMSLRWQAFQQRLSRTYTDVFGKISCAIYMSEYAFCWKQDSSIQPLFNQN